MPYAKRPKTQCTWEGCDKMLPYNPQRKTDMCRKHASTVANRAPDRRARISAAMKRKLALDPAYAAEHHRRMTEARNRNLETNPELREKYREIGRAMAARYPLKVPDDPAERSRRTRRGWSTKLAHIPVEHRQAYVELRQQGLSAAERERIIQEHADFVPRRYWHQVERQQKGSKS